MNSVGYWDRYYRSRPHAIDWYCGPETAEMCDALHRLFDDIAVRRNEVNASSNALDHQSRTLEVLHVGCGTSNFVSYLDYSRLIPEVTTSGSLVNVVVYHIDFVSHCLDTLQQLVNDHGNEELTGVRMMQLEYRFRVLDCSQLDEWDNETVDLIIDKGTTDAMLSSDNMEISESLKSMHKVFHEWARVLSFGGAAIVISIRNPHQLLRYLETGGISGNTGPQDDASHMFLYRSKIGDLPLDVSITRVSATPLEDPQKDSIWILTFFKT